MNNYPKYLILRNMRGGEEHIAKVLDLNDEERITLELTDNNKNRTFYKGEEIEILLPKKKSLFVFSSSILYFDILDRVLVVDYPEEITKLRERQYARYNVAIPLTIEDDKDEINTYTYDISLGGISFLVTKALGYRKGSFIPVSFNLGDKKLFTYLKLINSRPFVLKGKEFLLFGASFKSLEKEEFDMLLGYIARLKDIPEQQAVEH